MEPPEGYGPRLIDPPTGYVRLDERQEARMQFYAGLESTSRGRLHKWLTLEVIGMGIPGPGWSDKKIASAAAESIIRHLAGSSD